MKTHNKYIIAIDAGATCTEAMLFSTETGVIKENNYLPLNYNLSGEKQTIKKLIHIVNDILKKKYTASVMVAGISGARHEKDRKLIKSELKEKLKISRIEILPDTEIALASIFGKEDKKCGILIAGTGSILYYRDGKGKIKRVGGWGRHIGDEGSGYWIGKEALNRLGRYHDGIGEKTLLDSKLKKHFSIDKKTIVRKIYHENFEIAKIAEHVFDCAESGDKVSVEIISQAAQHLAEHFTVLGKSKMKIALTGSLFTKEYLLEKKLKQIVRKTFPNIRLIKPDVKPVLGAVKIGLE